MPPSHGAITMSVQVKGLRWEAGSQCWEPREPFGAISWPGSGALAAELAGRSRSGLTG
jgi:hypothetical protein